MSICYKIEPEIHDTVSLWPYVRVCSNWECVNKINELGKKVSNLKTEVI